MASRFSCVLALGFSVGLTSAMPAPGDQSLNEKLEKLDARITSLQHLQEAAKDEPLASDTVKAAMNSQQKGPAQRWGCVTLAPPGKPDGGTFLNAKGQCHTGMIGKTTNWWIVGNAYWSGRVPQMAACADECKRQCAQWIRDNSYADICENWPKTKALCNDADMIEQLAYNGGQKGPCA